VRRLIVNADDFGLTVAINGAIIDAHVHGIVTSTSLLVDAPAAAEAAVRAAAHPNLSVGLHFAQDDPAVLDDPNALRAAFERQLERFRSLLGRDPTHIDSHHHVHLSRLPAFSALVAERGIPLRGDGRVAYVGDFYGQPTPGRTQLEKLSRAHLLSLLKANAGHEIIELGCHPGRLSAELRSSYREEREVELRTLTDPGLREEIAAAGFVLVSFVGALLRSRE
jgi:predicted glycoside hydrolase/deacetylase ChbG (UPF0249 family)